MLTFSIAAQEHEGFGFRVNPVDSSIVEFHYPTKIHHDLSNCPKSILDALNTMAYEDDGQFRELHMSLRLKSETPGIKFSIMDTYKGG